MSPYGSRFPATTENDKAFAKNLSGKGSNEKPDAKLNPEEAGNDGEKIEVDVDVEKEVKVKDGTEGEAELQWYKEKTMPMEEQLRLLEAAMDENENRLTRELKDEKMRRYELEEELERIGPAYQEKLLALREREMDLREDAFRIAECGSSGKFEEPTGEETDVYKSTLAISDPPGDVLADLSMCRTLETRLVNDKISD